MYTIISVFLFKNLQKSISKNCFENHHVKIQPSLFGLLHTKLVIHDKGTFSKTVYLEQYK